jgi:hypothetical protein
MSAPKKDSTSLKTVLKLAFEEALLMPLTVISYGLKLRRLVLHKLENLQMPYMLYILIRCLPIIAVLVLIGVSF